MMQHSENINKEPDDPQVQAHNARLGLILFAIYLLAYVVYVAISTFSASWMESIVFSGLNLAVVYGMGLIVGALILAAIYTLGCRTSSQRESR